MTEFDSILSSLIVAFNGEKLYTSLVLRRHHVNLLLQIITNVQTSDLSRLLLSVHICGVINHGVRCCKKVYVTQ